MKAEQGQKGCHRLPAATSSYGRLPQSRWRGHGLAGFWISGLQNLEKTHFCCFQPSSLQSFISSYRKLNAPHVGDGVWGRGIAPKPNSRLFVKKKILLLVLCSSAIDVFYFSL